jgi:DNA-binding transcriptional LysR family regulator
VPNGHKLASRKEVRLTEIAREPLVTMPPESAAWGTLKGAFAAIGFEFYPRFQTQSALSVVAMVRAGLGVGFMTRLGASQVVTTGVTPLTLMGIEIGRKVGIVRMQGRSLPHAAQMFCKTLREVAPGYAMMGGKQRKPG